MVADKPWATQIVTNADRENVVVDPNLNKLGLQLPPPSLRRPVTTVNRITVQEFVFLDSILTSSLNCDLCDTESLLEAPRNSRNLASDNLTTDLNKLLPSLLQLLSLSGVYDNNSLFQNTYLLAGSHFSAPPLDRRALHTVFHFR